MMPSGKWSTPNPFRFFVWKCFSNLSCAASDVKIQSSSSKRKNDEPKRSSNFFRLPRSIRISFGEKLDKSLSMSSRVPSEVRNSPVEISRKAMPKCLPSAVCMAQRKLFPCGWAWLSSMANTRRYQFGNAPLDEFFGCFGVFQLIANGNSFACSHQFGQIGIECVMGKSGKFHKLGSAIGTSGERYAQNFGSDDGVIRKFVKTPTRNSSMASGCCFLISMYCFIKGVSTISLLTVLFFSRTKIVISEDWW